MASKKYTFKFDVDSQGFEQSLNNIANKIRDIFSNISIPTDSLDKAVKNVETSLNSVLKNYSTAMSKQDFSAISGSLSNASAEMKNLLSTINSSSFSGKNSAVNSVNEIINSLTKAQQVVGKFDDMAGSVGNSINNMIPANAAERISELNKQLEKLSATQKLVQNLRVDEDDIFAQGSTAEGFDSIIAKAKEYKTVLKDFNSSTKNIDFSKAMQVDPTSIENLAKAKNSGEQLSILIEKLEGNPLDLSKILGKNFDTKSFEATFDNLGDYIDRNMTEIESSVAKMVTSTQSELDSLKQSANSTTSLMFNSSGSSDIEQTNSKSNYSKSGRKITLTLDHKKLDADFDAELKSLGEKAAANPIPVTLKLQTTADSINVGELAEKVNKKKKNTPVENTVELQVNLDSKKAESKLATAIGNLQKIADKKIVKIPVSIDYDSGNLKIDNAKVEESIKKANDISNLKNEYGVGKKNNSKVQVESEVDVDPAKIQTNAAALVAAYNDALAKMPVKVTIDDSFALKNVNALVSKYESKTGSLGKYNYDFSVVVNETGATQTIANLDSLLKVYDNQEINLNVDVTGISETFKKVNSLYETLKVLVRNPIIIKTEASVPAATSAQKVALTAGTIKAKDIKVTGKVGIPVEPKINIRSFVASINKLLSGSTVKINTEPVVKNNTASAQIANSSTIKTELSKTDVASVKSDYTKLLTGLRNRAPVKVKIKLGEKTETPDIADITKLSEASQTSLQKHQALMESISTKEIELIGNIIAKASELNEAIRLGVKDLSSSLSTLNKLGVDITSKGSISNAKVNIAKAKKTTTTAATIDTQPETSQENLDIATLTAQYNTYNTGLEKSYKLENQILSLRSQKGNNKDQIAVLTQRKEAIDENIAKLREEIDGNTVDSNSIKGLKAQREAIIKTMQEQHRAEVELGNAKISDSQTKDTSSTIDSKYEKYIEAQANATSKLNAISKTLSSETSSQITQATGLIEKYIKTQEDAGVSMESTIKDCRDGKVSLEDLTKAYADFNATTKTTYEQAKKLTTSQYSTIIRGLGSAVKDSNGNTLNFSGESNALNQVKQETSGMKNVTISDWRTTVNGMKEVIVTASDLNGGITKIKYTFNELNGAMYKTSAASDTTITAFDRMTVSAKKVVSYFIHYAAMFLSAQTFYQAIRQGVTYVESLDTALTSLQVVTGKSDEELSQFATDAQRIATSVASTTTEVVNSATDWARLGYSMSDSLELAAQSAKLAKTGFMEVSEATEYMTSSIQAFYGADIQNGLTSVADAALHINDELVQIGNTQPITSEGLGEALEKSAASLVAAGNSVEQSVALVASSNSVLQNPSSVGNALKTVSMRLRGTDSDQIAEETGEEIEGMNTSASKLYETIRKLTSVKSNDYQGISILTSTGSFRSTFDILKDISQVWSEMNDVSKAGLLEDVAGKRQSAAVAAIFNNPNSLTSAYESANSATGASDTAMTIALDSVEAKVSKLQNSWQAFWQTLIDSDSAKKILDIVNAIVTGLDKIIAGGNSIGNLSSLVAILTGGSQIIKTIMSDQPSQYSGGRVKKFALKNMPPTGSTVMCVNCA